ncbi:MAG: hypothetical protein A2X86_13525 [Bdellovibrionales bacterium GWA2_49_15]|nr:MAG: hypothetical protein A2X86_13525 [Bdellovibrionales bacterium GWA2_49_15]HAZ13546.1 hypothetical protein [Bdellovibrionales bacterium]
MQFEASKIRPWHIALLFLVFKMMEWFLFFRFIPSELTEFKLMSGLSMREIFLPLEYKGTFRWCWSSYLLPHLLRDNITLFPFYLVLNAIIFVLARQVFVLLGLEEKGALLASFLLANFYNFFILAVEDRALMFCFLCIYLLWHLKTFLQGNFKFSWALSLVLVSFAFEQWIDLALVLILWCAHCTFIKKEKKLPLIFAYTGYLGVWIGMRFLLIGNLQELQIPGGEQSFIFSYQHWATGIEDFWHNILKYAHASFWTPWPFFGPAPLVIQTMKGAHLFSDVSLDSFFQEDFVYFNFLFSWYLYVGATAALAIWLARRWRSGLWPFKDLRFGGLFLLLWLFGSSIHWWIKFKPYLALPYYFNYKAVTANIGALGLWGLLATPIAGGKVMQWWKAVWHNAFGFGVIILLLNIGMWWKAHDALAQHAVYDKYNSVKSRIWQSGAK